MFRAPAGYLGTERIDRNGQCGSDPPHGGHPRFHTTPLLLGRHLGGSGPGGVASDVEQIATGIGRFADTPFDSLASGVRLPAKKESGVTLTIAITRGVVKSGRMFSVFIA